VVSIVRRHARSDEAIDEYPLTTGRELGSTPGNSSNGLV
jgi:hypothetical protein